MSHISTLAGVTLMYVPGLWCKAEQERGKMWNKHISFTNLAAQIHVLLIFSLTKASLPFPREKLPTCPARELTARLHCELNASAENAMEKKPKFGWAAPTGKQFRRTWEKGRLWRRTSTAPDLKEVGQRPGLKVPMQLWKLSQRAASRKTSKELAHAFLISFESPRHWH